MAEQEPIYSGAPDGFNGFYKLDNFTRFMENFEGATPVGGEPGKSGKITRAWRIKTPDFSIDLGLLYILNTSTGNLIVDIPGSPDGKGEVEKAIQKAAEKFTGVEEKAN